MYSINDIAEMTGLTDRTLRNYLNAGFLQGEKIDGKWQFMPEQFTAFLRHEAVKPALEAKRNSAVFDFLADAKKPADAACVMLDWAGADPGPLSDFFCEAVNAREGLQMSLYSLDGHTRVILTGPQAAVLEVMVEYRAQFGK